MRHIHLFYCFKRLSGYAIIIVHYMTKTSCQGSFWAVFSKLKLNIDRGLQLPKTVNLEANGVNT